MIRTTKCGVLVACALAWGCSSSGGAPSADGGGADAAEGADAAPGVDGGAQTMPGSSSDASGSDSGAIVYASSCADAGRVPATPSGSWSNATSNLAGLGSECGNLSNLSSKPDEDLLIAGVAQQGLWGSTNGGASWSRLGMGSGSATITNRTSDITYDPAHPATFWESGIYNGVGVYRTTDDGTTLLAMGTVTHNDSISVDFTDPNRQTLLAGTHEQSGHLFRSANGGATWTDIGPMLPAGTGFATQALVIDAQTHLVGAYTYSNTGSGLGIFRTTNGGQAWTQVFTSPVQGHPLVMPGGTIYWSVGNSGGLVQSSDKGATWQMTVGKNVLVTGSPVALPDGRIAALGSQAVMVSAGLRRHVARGDDRPPLQSDGPHVLALREGLLRVALRLHGQEQPRRPRPERRHHEFAFDYRTQ